MNIYKAIKIRATRMDVSIAKIERKADLANGTIGKWRTNRPYADSLRRVADVLGCTVNDIQDEAKEE